MINNKRTIVWIPLLIAVAFAGGFWAGGRFSSDMSGGSMDPARKIATILNLIDNEYVDRIDTDSLLEATIPDLLAKLDPHTLYIPAENLSGVNEDLEGSFGGVGIQFTMLHDTIAVLEIVAGGPSEKAGLLAGDRIVTIDDSLVAGVKMSTDRVMKMLRGPEGTDVRLGVSRGGVTREYVVTRGMVPVTTIDAAYMLDPKTGYIKINKFGRATYSEFLAEMIRLKALGAEGVVIDLRGNTGGFMEMAIVMANEFLEGGLPIVSTHGRVPSAESNTFADGTGSFKDIRLAVVIDEFSASSSEIFAGAIQDNDRGTVVGRRSFGKGLVQRQVSLPDSSAIRITTARYYTPSGRSIQKPYVPGESRTYEEEIFERYANGETQHVDTARLDTTHVFHTRSGRPVYGGGGIMPDIFVANDTSGFTPYYFQIFNLGMMQRYAFDYVDQNRERLSQAKNTAEIASLLPYDDVLLYNFVNYARDEGGVAPRWFYINISHDLIVSQLKALIARDILGTTAYYEIVNNSEEAIETARRQISDHKIYKPRRTRANTDEQESDKTESEDEQDAAE